MNQHTIDSDACRDSRRSSAAHTLTATALLVVSGALAAGALATAPPAMAASKYVAIAYSPVTHSYGYGRNQPTLDAAHVRALDECSKAGGSHCVTVTWAQTSCAALAVKGEDYYGWYGATLQAAEQEALQRNGGGVIAVSRCAS
jgi:hypothetical protein